jgi:FkbM family methyltransferase
MAIAAWKRLEKSPGYQQKKLVLKRLVGKEPRLRTDVELATVKKGGWWFHPDALDETSLVYSLGVGEDVEFDLALIRGHGVQVHAFDPTPSTLEWLGAHPQPPSFHFHPWAVTSRDGVLTLYPRVRKDGSKSGTMYTMVADDAARDAAVEVPALSLPTILKNLGHRRIDLLKMDIEGAEYEVLESLPNLEVQPVQLLVEFHHRFPGIGPAKTVAAVDALRRIGYRLFAVSETGRELSFIHDQYRRAGT